jgi:RsmE family RNA methyltransferase
MNIVLIEPGERFFPRGDERYAHIRKVLRKGANDSFLAGEIDGPKGPAVIEGMDERGCSFSFEGREPSVPLYPITVIVGFPRPIQLKRLLRDLASLGVASISLCATELGEKSYLESTLVDRGAARAALLDGCMQAGMTALPTLEMRESAAESIERDVPRDAARVILDVAEGAPSLARLSLGEGESALALAVGSERGWTEGERALFRSRGFQTTGLGPRILRTETACVAAVSVALARMGYLDREARA